MVNIDTIYQRVLAISNKEQRGYITPQEFNLFANQAQNEIFEQYFYDLNQFERIHGNDNEYSDMVKILKEKISIFEEQQVGSTLNLNQAGFLSSMSSNLVQNGDFATDISNWTISGNGSSVFDSGKIRIRNAASGDNVKATQTVSGLEIGSLYFVSAEINTQGLNTSGSNSSAKAYVKINGEISAKRSVGSLGSVGFYFTANATSADVELNVEVLAQDPPADYALFDDISVRKTSSKKVQLISRSNKSIYRLGSVIYQHSTKGFIELDRVSPKDMIYIDSSPLTKPTATRPAFVANGVSDISIYPASINVGDIYFNYIRKPDKCNWGYTVQLEKALYDSSTSKNFELHESEDSNLTNRILELAGLASQKPDVQQAGLSRDGKETQQQKQ